MDALSDYDLGPLTWVKDEIALALDNAKKLLQAWNGTDLTPLKVAATHLHQVQGALQMVDLQGVARVCEAAESLLSAMERHPALRQGASVDSLLAAIEALRHYLDRLAETGQNTELALAPTYARLLESQGEAAPAPSDLFFPDVETRAPRLSAEPAFDDLHRQQALHRARVQMQKGMLPWLTGRDSTAGLEIMLGAARDIERTVPGGAQYTFWWAVTGLVEALQRGDIATDIWLKKLFGRIDLQLKRLIGGSRQVAERLLRDVLYHQAGLPNSGRAAEVEALFQLRRLLPEAPKPGPSADRQPAIKACRAALEKAKEHWLRFCSGKTDGLPAMQQDLRAARAAATGLDNAALATLLGALDETGARLPGVADAARDEGLHLELATTLLFAQNALEHYDNLGSEFAGQVAAQTQRLDTALSGQPELDAAPSVPLLDEFSRQAQEKLLVAQVTQEIQSNLHQVETILDAFFRDRAERAGLPTVPGLMNQVLGALNMLQLDVAADLARLSIDEIAGLSEAQREISKDELDWIADAISSLGLYVEALRHGRDDQASLRSLLAGPAATSGDAEASLEAVTQEKAAELKDKLDKLADAPVSAAEQAALRDDLRQITQDAELIGDTTLREQADTALRLIDEAAPVAAVQAAFQEPTALAPDAETLRLAEASGEEFDAEMLDVYIEEARQVLDAIAGDLDTLAGDNADANAFTDIRRGFHTLKGSGRMVGLTDPAETAWEVEQTLNHWLREARLPNGAMLDFVGDAAEAFRGWVEQLAATGHVMVDATELVAQARALRAEPPATPSVTDAPPPPPLDTPAEPPTEATEPPVLAEAPELAPDAPPEDETRHFGEHVVPSDLLRIFLDEAEQRLADLTRHWNALDAAGPPLEWEGFTRAAHTLAGISRTTGFQPLADAAHVLETWARAWAEQAPQAKPVAAPVPERLADLRAMRQAILDGQFPATATYLAALPEPPAPIEAEPEPDVAPVAATDATLVAEAAEAIPAVAETAIEPVAPQAKSAPQGAPVEDELDPELLAIFLAEADELLPRIGESLRQWRSQPDSAVPRQVLQRALHTLKGSARMAGALVLGEATHDLESRLAGAGQQAGDSAFLESLEHDYDHLAELVERLRPGHAAPAATGRPEEATRSPTGEDGPRAHSSFKGHPAELDTLINETGEVSIARARIETVLASYKLTAEELTANIERLRGQLRELDLQAETRMRARQTTVDDNQFDPLEFDRYTRLQELTRLMAESVNDVSTAQEGLLANIGEAESALAHQAKMTRSLQQQLMRIRMVPLNSQAERLHRIVRQAAKETGHKARLHIDGGATELDRGVLDKVFGPLEHLLRNAVAHGIEAPEARKAANKPDYGEIRLMARAEGNEIVLSLSDDGAGIDLARVQQRAEELGWLKPGEAVERERLEAMLFLPGLSTARQVTQVAGRGIGLDVVKSELAGIGGRIRLVSESGAGTQAILRLPLTLALAQVVLARAGDQTFALPANLIALVREIRLEDWPAIAEAGSVEFDGQRFPLRSLTQLTGQEARPLEGRFRTLLLLRAGNDRMALRVDALQGNLEAVVKNIGPQLARIVGIAGATVLGDGRVALILNPFALLEQQPIAHDEPQVASAYQEEQAPLILVVDDSLTVRKITGRLLTRHGYRVATAKDGAEAMEMLQDEMPAVMLLDIEMPRMDGFEVTRHVRADAKTRRLPIIMISSRTAEKHRQHAFELGVDTFMGKPYQDDALLGEIESLRQRPAA